MKYHKYLWFILCVTFLGYGCKSDSEPVADSESEASDQTSDKVQLSIQNESSYSLSDVSWRGITFFSSIDGRTIPPSSVAKNSVEKDASGKTSGYVFFTREGAVSAKLRSFEVVAVTDADKIFRIMDNMLVVEVGNTENSGTLADIVLSLPDYYTVSFESNGGTYVEPYTVQRGKEITVAPAIQKENTAFAGWFSDTNFNQKIEFPYVPESDSVLYAEWKSPPHSVPFTGTRSSSTIKIQITPSDDKYFDCYRVVCYQEVKAIFSGEVISLQPVLDSKTKDSSYEIHELDWTSSPGTYKDYAIELYVIDKFGQQSEMYLKKF